ncbi:hypothetical protein RB195_002870 [Necator americanus]|uniref:Uncharacterized protein n=1 Tax=Necator americanus TaxID=51031 RepID=A0ABR1DLR2_NECAM
MIFSEEDFRLAGEMKKPRGSENGEPRTITNWDLFATLGGSWEDSAMDSIDEEYDRLVEKLHVCKRKAQRFKTMRRLSPETPELMRQREAARAAGNQELASELARLCREAIKEYLKERRAEVLVEATRWERAFATPVENSPIEGRRELLSGEPEGNNHFVEKGNEKIIHDFYSLR